MAVSQKVISGNIQPDGGSIVTGVGGAKGLASADKIDANHTTEPVIIQDDAIAVIDTKLDARFDDPRYYTGDAPT